MVRSESSTKKATNILVQKDYRMDFICKWEKGLAQFMAAAASSGTSGLP